MTQVGHPAMPVAGHGAPQSSAGGLMPQQRLRLAATHRLQLVERRQLAEQNVATIKGMLDAAIAEESFPTDDLDGRVLEWTDDQLKLPEKERPERVSEVEQEQARQEHERRVLALRSSLRDARHSFRDMSNAIAALDANWVMNGGNVEELQLESMKVELEVRKDRLRRESGLGDMLPV